MRITILVLGSQGDVQPLVTLGAALQASGHRVRVATFAAFAPMITRAGLDYFPLRGDVQALLGADRDEPVGKMLDFLAQEFYREANTINSKSQDLAITRESLLIKAEVESIRQQVQNLE
jgi:UDP:flavonoid glycosyltransferase YjiC (YdhE family)